MRGLKLKLFILRNQYTALLANSILNLGTVNKGVGIILQPPNVEHTLKFYDEMESILLNNGDWEYIHRFQSPRYCKYTFIPIINAPLNMIITKIYVQNRIRFYKYLFNKYHISEVVFCHVHTNDLESIVIKIAIEKDIVVSKYDEAIYAGYFGKLIIKSDVREKNFIKDLLYTLVFGNFKNTFRFYSIQANNIFESYYSLFPQLYPYENVKQRVKVKLHFDSINLGYISIFLTSSLSEDGIISLNEEIELMLKISKLLPTNTAIKFHPRDSYGKKYKILNLTGYQDITDFAHPAETLINDPKLCVLSGYMTSTLFIAAELRPQLEINSFLGLLGGNVINKVTLEEIQTDFPNINFHLDND